MKKALQIILAIVLGFNSMNLSAQSLLTVHDGTGQSGYVPIYGFYCDSYLKSEFIIPANEITAMTGSNITSLKFYTSQSNISWGNAHFLVFMKEVEQTTLNSFLVTAPGTPIVYSGSLSVANGEMEIILSNPYSYGGGNLLIGIYNDQIGNYVASTWYGDNDMTGASVQGFSYNSLADVQPNQRNFIPKTTFTYSDTSVTCFAPASTTISNASTTTATMSWVPGEGQTEWEVYCDTGTVDLSQVTWIPVAGDSSYTFTGLTANTQYTAYIRTVCGSQASISRSVSFLTANNPVSVPFSLTFENDILNNVMTIRNGEQVNKWYIGTAVNNTSGGQKALYVSNDNGISNAYNENSESFVWAFFDVDLPNSTEFALSFDWMAYGEMTSYTSYDYLEVFIGNPYDVQAGYIPNNNELTSLGMYNLQSTWQHTTLILPAEVANTTKRIYFLWVNDFSQGTNPPAAIDNITISSAVCHTPLGITATDITTTSVTLDLTPGSRNDHEWEIICTDGDQTMIFNTTDTTGILIDNLTSSTHYTMYARTICNEGDTSMNCEPISVFTSCVLIDTIPQTWDFETFDNYTDYLPVCWNRAGSDYYPYCYYNYVHTGTFCLYSGPDPADYIAILPEVDTSVMDISDLQIEFYARYHNDYGATSAKIEIGVMTDPSDPNSFTMVDTVTLNNGLTEAYDDFLVPLTHYYGNGTFIALRFSASGEFHNTFYYSTSIFVDEVSLYHVPTCARPEQVTISENGQNNVTITWLSNEDAFNIYYKTTDAENYILANNTPVTSTTYTLTNLAENTTYDLYVTSVCTDLTETPSHAITFTTLCAPVIITPTLPYHETFNSLTNDIPDCWNNSEGTTSNPQYRWKHFIDAVTGECMRFDSYLNPTNYTNMLKTPSLDLSALTTPELTFSFKNPTGGDFSIFYSTDGGATYNSVLATGLTGVRDWTEASYIIPTNAHNVVIVFAGTSNYGTGDAFIYLDDVWVGEYVSCTKPDNLVVTNTLEHNSISLSFQETGDAISWNVAYGPTGFSFNDNPTIVAVTDTNITITGLLNSQVYDFYVQANCGEEVSAWRGPVTATPGSFTFGVTGQSSITSCGITLYDNGGPAHDYSANCDYALTVYPTDPDSVVTVSGVLYTEVDINYDYLYIYDGSSISGTPIATLTGYIGDFGPYTSNSGPLTIRFTSDMSIQNPGFEAYVSCVAAPTCRAPYGVNANASTHEALISWTAPAGATVELYYKEHDDSVYNVVTAAHFTTDNSYLMTNLTPVTLYDVYVANICSDDTLFSEVITFVTSCYTISNYPYTETFSGNSSSIECWTIVDANLDGRTFAYDVFNELMFYHWDSYNTANDWLISPVFSLDGNQIADFDYWSSTGFEEKFQVFAMSDDTLITLSPVIAVQTNDIQNLIVNLGELTGEYQVAIHCISVPDQYNLYIDNFRVRNADVPELTVEPTFLHFHTDVGVASESKTAMVSGISLSSDILATTSAPFELSNDGQNYSTSVTLPANALVTKDTLYIRYNPTVGGTQVGLVNLTSGNETASITLNGRSADCGAQTLPYSEDFNSYNDGISASTNCPNVYPDGDLPLCWTFLNRSASISAYPMAFISYAPNYSVNGNCLFFKSSYSLPIYAVLPHFPNDIHTMKIEFSYRNEGTTDANGTLSVGYMTNLEDLNSFVEIATMERVTVMTEASVQFNTIPSSITDAYIVFKYTGGTQNNYYMSIDDVEVIEIAPQPINPTVITTAATDIEQTNAKLNAIINNPDSVNISACGFEWKLAGDAEYTTVTLAYGSNIMNHTLTGLTANTTYTYKAFITYNDNTVYGDTINFTTLEEEQPTCYTPTNVTASNVTYNAADVNWIAGDSETAWNVQYKPASASNWSNFIPVTAPTYHLSTLNASTTYQVRVQAVCSDFEASEWTEPITFTTDVEPVEPCEEPTDLQLSNITYNSATMSWNAGSDETSWKIGYKLATSGQWLETTVNTTTYNITGLTASSTYNVRVKAICGDNNESSFITSSFTTGVGIDNLTLANSISLMPNPADHYIELSVNSNVEVKEAVVFNAFGQMIQTVQLTDNHARIDLSNMASGMYFVRVSGDNATATKKFIKK